MKKNQAGQMTVEAVLIITLLIGSTMATTRMIKEKKLLASLVEEPWQYLSGMIENGVWGSPAEGKTLHPNHIERHGSPRGDTP